MSSEQTVNSGRKLFFGLFVFPLLIAIGMAILLCSVVLLTHEDESPESLIAAIKTGSASKRWQKAFELSNELNRSKNSLRDSSVVSEIISILKDSERYDSKTRAYMALALGRFDTPEAIEALSSALKDGDTDVQIYALWSLGNLKSRSASPFVIPFTKDANPELRKISAYVLGVIGDNSASDSLRALLEDSSVEVKWNAALSLARLDDSSGFTVISEMLDRDTFERFESMQEPQIENVMINAVKGLALLQTPQAQSLLESVSKNEMNLKVRQAALEAVQISKGSQR